MNISISIDIPTEIFLTILLFVDHIDYFKIARIRTNTRIRTKEKPYDKFVIFAKLVRQESHKCKLSMM